MKAKIIELIFQIKSACLSKEEMIRASLCLTPAEFRGLLALSPDMSIPCKILSKKMGLSVSRCSRVIDKMIKDKYLKGIKSNNDQRIINVTLTPKGIKTQQKIHRMLGDCEKLIVNSMSKKELTKFEDTLIKISEILISD